MTNKKMPKLNIKIPKLAVKLPSFKLKLPKFKSQNFAGMNLMAHRKWFYLISLLIIIPGLVSLAVWRLKPSIDFTGGSQIEIKNVTDTEAAKKFASENGLENVTVQKIGNDSVTIRFKEIDEAKHKDIKDKISNAFGPGAEEVSFETVGPSISKELTRNSFTAIGLASLVIIIYVAFSFRKVPKPANSWEFGITAVIALLHDAIVITGIFSILGHFYNVEVDPLFITALLTIIGFSVHDTIVIFDRIRENLIRSGAEDFEEVVEKSVQEMLPRTLNTSFLVWVILLVLLIFGGTTIRYFVLALVIGVFSGTYSSILNAAPLLITWQNFKTKK